MKQKRIKMLIITMLLTIEISSIFLTWKSFTVGPTKLEEVKIKDNAQINTKNSLAIMLNNGDGNYTQSSNNAFPSTGYLYNSEKSGCIDSNGAKIENALTYNQTENKAVVKTDRTSNCYLYFDKKEKPSAFTFYIGGSSNPATVSSTSTTVYLNWTDNYVTHYCINTQNNASSCTWTATNNQKTINANYALTSGDGTKTLYAFLKDSANNISESVSDSIEYKQIFSGNANQLVQSKPANLNTTLEGGLYRYQGAASAVTNNYICFGTKDKATCTSDTDKYMYRIIGMTSTGQLKLIKKEALNTGKQWWTDDATNKIWPDSLIYSTINGSDYLTNTTYIPNGWESKIADTTWKYGKHTNADETAISLYNKENSWSTTTDAKIGLIYMHDYYYASKNGGENCSSSGGQNATCKNSWLYLRENGNDIASPVESEWTMSYYGYFMSNYNAWCVTSDGYAYIGSLQSLKSIRPVFFLKNTVQISGEGTLTSPYVIIN